ncbi:MAG: DHH family phosphoesterase, partial [Helicobacter sp.]|nr:DHH family phosphoesterase [Helicobacter sp.]
PNRFSHGYGLSKAIVENIEADMIITVDNGISAIEAAEICRQRGIELIVTDHHTPQEKLPDALICNPKLSPLFVEKEICGACVAWYLCASIKQQMNLQISMVEFLDLLALAIVSDVMPLRGINWVLLKKGLEVLYRSRRVALVLLKEHFKKHAFNARLLSYYIAPLLNSAGRMGSAMESYEFLIEKDYKKALKNLRSLLECNEKRKMLQNEVYLEAKNQFCSQENFQEIPLIVVHDSRWSEGVIGIVAAKLYEEFLKPSIVLSNQGLLKGSMRGFDCMGILYAYRAFLESFGGHSCAAGIKLKEENLQSFKEALRNFKESDYQEESSAKNVLGMLHFKHINEELFSILDSFEPYGEWNGIPKFFTHAIIKEVYLFGDVHSDVILQEGGIVQRGVMFRHDLSTLKNKEVCCCYSVYKDLYQRIRLQLESVEALEEVDFQV